MLLHVVLLQPKAGVASEAIEHALEHVVALQDTIPGILEVQSGPNKNTTHNQGYTYGFVMRFADEEHLKAYAPHPAHQEVARELVSLCERIIDFDLPV